MPCATHLQVRDPWFKMAHDILDENLANDGPLRGILFWEWDSDGTGPRDGKDSTVRDYDSTMKVTSHEGRGWALPWREGGAEAVGADVGMQQGSSRLGWAEHAGQCKAVSAHSTWQAGAQTHSIAPEAPR